MAQQQIASLTEQEEQSIRQRLYEIQQGLCFICEERIDSPASVHSDIDHIDARMMGGPDIANNYALTHKECNRSKQASPLKVARAMATFGRLQREARAAGERGADLSHILKKYKGSTSLLRLSLSQSTVDFKLSGPEQTQNHSAPLLRDHLSGMSYFFASLPIEYLHHDDRINPRNIDIRVRGLIDEFIAGRPQLHVSLAWWESGEDGAGAVKVFDGQHKAAAQILLGERTLPVRIFVEPDTNNLLVANTNAGGKLRQVGFSTEVFRHLGSTQYTELLAQYRRTHNLLDDDLSFSEADLVRLFRNEHRSIESHIIDGQRDSITHDDKNTLKEFVEPSGKTIDRPLSYNAVETSFYKHLLYKKALVSPLNKGAEDDTNPRQLEREQLIRIMNLFAKTFFVDKWDSSIGGYNLENRVQKGEPIPDNHLRAWRAAREEIIDNEVSWIKTVIYNHLVTTSGQSPDQERLLQAPLPEVLWEQIENFLEHLANLPCWIDKGLSGKIFGSKQNLNFWKTIFATGDTPSGTPVLPKALNHLTMIQPFHQST